MWIVTVCAAIPPLHANKLLIAFPKIAWKIEINNFVNNANNKSLNDDARTTTQEAKQQKKKKQIINNFHQ